MNFKKISREAFVNDMNSYNKDIDAIAVYDHIKLPVRGTERSAGYDFCSPLPGMILPHGESVTIPTGISFCLDEGDDEHVFLMIVPRSSFGIKKRCSANNTVCIIDSDYYLSPNEGDIIFSIRNNSYEDVRIAQGERIMQGIILPYLTCGDQVSTTRNGGIGSTT